jgi:HAD superfamily hydrolase (TIGR01484 family)
MIRLLSTDFDGTLVDHFAVPPVSADLLDTLERCRNKGILWAVNTGRTLEHIVEGLKQFGFPVSPDFVLTTEREVFRRTRDDGWEDFGDWNSRCARAHSHLFQLAAPLLKEIVAFVETETEAQVIYDGLAFIGLVTRDDSEMDRVVAFIEKVRDRVPQFHYQRNTIYLRFCHVEYHKGAALGELTRLLDLEPRNIFAIGDHLNDIPMLDRRYAHWVACPGNSIDAVKEAVWRSNGYVARSSHSEGVLEALRHFENGDSLWARVADCE